MRGLLRCSFYWIGQCESLDMRDEQRVQLPRFLYLCLNLNNNSTHVWAALGDKEKI